MRVNHIFSLKIDPTQSKVTKIQMPIEIHHNIFRLKISIQYLTLMQLLKGQQNLCETYFGFYFLQFSICQMVKQLASWVEFEEEVEVLVALETGLEASHELEIIYQLAHYFLLPQHCLKHAKMVEVIFFYLLEGIQLPIGTVPHKVDSTRYP